ncbi:MAG: thioether cross-link-forming SCIFF peptide maturase [Oscillospiraceae bacterium]|nr:thioether cross-link-forming SCIFF peptide maturase [Oscillospiraceae bacterium]
MIHCYQLGGVNIVLDINSGSIHVCDDESYAAIRDWEENGSNAANPAIAAEIDALIRSGKLFSPEHNAVAPGTDYSVKALCLNVAHSCNLRCTYCFTGHNLDDGAALMSFETGKTALDFLVANCGGHRNLEVDFFGGEPLLNWDVVKRLLRYARTLEAPHNVRFRFTLTTNGLLLDNEKTEFCNAEFDNVVLSLDGREATHDRFRKFPDGTGSFTVVEKIQRFVEKRNGDYYIRGTYTRENLDFVADLLALQKLGFKHLALEPVVAGSDKPYSLRDENLPRLFAEYEKLAFEMAARAGTPDEFTFYHYSLDLENGPCLHKRCAGCGAGTEYYCVTPDGSLYPCHQFVGDADFIVGDIWRGVVNRELTDTFAKANLFSRPDCADCWAKFYCAGGCSANAYHAAGSLNGTYKLGCELFRKRMECAIWLAAKAY